MAATKTLRPVLATLRATTSAPKSYNQALEAQAYVELENENERETVIPPASVARRLIAATLV